MEESATIHSISGISARPINQTDAFSALERYAEEHSTEYLDAFANAVVHNSYSGLLNIFRRDEMGKTLYQLRKHTKKDLKDRCFPELPLTISLELTKTLLEEHLPKHAFSVLLMMNSDRKPDTIKKFYKLYNGKGYFSKLYLLDYVFGVDYSKNLGAILK